MQKNLNLISKFQKELEISKREATVRVIFFYFLVACSIATFALLLYPHERNLTEKVILPFGNYTELKDEMPKEKVLLSEEQFQKIFQRTSSVSFDDYNVVCINEINGVFFYCNHRLRWLKAKESLW